MQNYKATQLQAGSYLKRIKDTYMYIHYKLAIPSCFILSQKPETHEQIATNFCK